MKYKVFLLFLCSFSVIARKERSVAISFNAPQSSRQDFSADVKSNVRYGVRARRSTVYRQIPKMLTSKTLCGIKKYFRWLGLSEKKILEQTTWYVVPAFVKFVQQFDGYSETIERLYKEFGKIGGWKKFKLFCKGQYTSGLQEVICKLNERLQDKKQRQQSITFEKRYNISSDVCGYLTAYNIEVNHLTHYHGTHDEHQLHDQLCMIAHKATGITKSYNCLPQSNLFIDVIGDGLACGVQAHHHHKTKITQAWVGFCWKAIDCVQAFCEGAVLGVQNTAHHLLHPIETVQNLLFSAWTIAELLAKTVHTVGLCAHAYVVDYDEFLERKNNIGDSLKYLKNRTHEVVSTTDARTIIKYGTAFAVEAMLFKKACSIAYKTTKRILPSVKKVASYKPAYVAVEKGEVLVEPLVDFVVSESNPHEWVSKGGLVYGLDNKFGSRMNHVLQHTVIREGKNVHSVFNVKGGELFELIDYAWLKRGLQLQNDPGVYVIKLGRAVGTEGETAIKIATLPGTSKILTAYPVKG